jgi:hypothetical protein
MLSNEKFILPSSVLVNYWEPQHVVRESESQREVPKTYIVPGTELVVVLVANGLFLARACLNGGDGAFTTLGGICLFIPKTSSSTTSSTEQRSDGRGR